MTFNNQIFKEKECHSCGTSFIPNSGAHKYCSKDCSYKVKSSTGKSRSCVVCDDKLGHWLEGDADHSTDQAHTFMYELCKRNIMGSGYSCPNKLIQ